jgi:hypothetical protein
VVFAKLQLSSTANLISKLNIFPITSTPDRSTFKRGTCKVIETVRLEHQQILNLVKGWIEL